MSRDFTIYRVPSLKKVGCTRNFKKSCRERYSGRRVIILEIIPARKGPKYAGDIEWKYAVEFGYKRSNHYLNTWDFKLTNKQRRHFGRLGYTKRSAKTKAFDYLSKIGKIGGSNSGGPFASMNKTLIIKISRKAGKAAVKSRNHPNNRTLKCPHCAMINNIVNSYRCHFDNCSKS